MALNQNSHRIGVEETTVTQCQKAFLREASRAVESTASLRSYLERLKKQWGLPNIDTSEVLSESISRGVRYIASKGEAIDNPIGWLRAVSLNIIRDEAKAVAKERRLQERIAYEYDSSPPDPFQDPEFLEEVETLRSAMDVLSEADRTILRHRFFEKQRYREIQAKLEAEEGKKTTVAALRKRESRALKRLREGFLQLKEEEQKSSTSA